MTSPNPSKFRRAWTFFWSLVDSTRRLLFNLIFLLLLGIVLLAVFRGGGSEMQDKTVLVLNLGGQLVEQRSVEFGDNLGRELFDPSGSDTPQQTQLRDVLTVLDAAAKDPKIERVLLSLDDFSGGGLAALREVAAALSRFRASGKQVIAWGANFDQKQYYLAAHADEVWLHPMGMVLLDGYGGYRNYYRDALDRLGISANVIRVGKYKNFGEPFFANGPSPETIEADTALYQGLWSTYLDDVEKARKLPAGSIAKLIEELPQAFAAAGNDVAKLALDHGLVTRLMTRDQLRQTLIGLGAENPEKKTFRQISFAGYLASQRPTQPFIGDAVGVVVAEGEISDGRAPAGHVGGLSTAELIRKARNDDTIKAVVLRINSPGGSAFGSELIRRELEITREAGKPVVVSMGSVAASGGYWISLAADRVIADPATITGSIGVFAMLPTAEKAVEKLSINTGGVATTWLKGAYDPRRPLDPRAAELVQGMIGKIYSDFTGLAAKARGTTPEKIDEVAQGRVWTGTQARERGLIDQTGSFDDALKTARELAKLPETTRTAYIEPDMSTLQKLAMALGAEARQTLAEQLGVRLLPAELPSGAAREIQHDMLWLAEMNRHSPAGIPFMPLTHCFCDR